MAAVLRLAVLAACLSALSADAMDCKQGAETDEEALLQMARSTDAGEGRGGDGETPAPFTFWNPPPDENGITAGPYDGHSCRVMGRGKPQQDLDSDRQAYFTILSDGAGVGVVGGTCSVAVKPEWSSWVNPVTEGGGCTGPTFWLMFFQGTTSIAQRGKSIRRVKTRMQVPPKPEATVSSAYSAWTFGIQPARQPDLDDADEFCQLEGGKEGLAYNSGLFSGLRYRTPGNSAWAFNSSIFNQPQQGDWDDKLLVATNAYFGQSDGGPAFGYAAEVQPGQFVDFEARLGRCDQELEGNNMYGWYTKQTVGDLENIMFVNTSAYESIFWDQAVEQGVLDPSKPEDALQGELTKNNTWNWAVGPVYEYTLVLEIPPVEEIPKLWPSTPVLYYDTYLEVESGATWETDPDGEDWLLKFTWGMESTGMIFGGTDNAHAGLFTDYNKLAAFIENNVTTSNHPDDFPQVNCWYACAKSRHEASTCTPKQVDGVTLHDCVLQFLPDFPPNECKDACWSGNDFTCKWSHYAFPWKA